MPKFSYTVKDAKGQTTTTETEAYDKNSLIQQLQSQGFFILKVEELIGQTLKPRPATSSQRKKFAHRDIKLTDMLTFARQMVTMLESGVTLLRSLEVILDQVESEKFYHVLSTVVRDVEQGSTFSESLAQHPRVFNQFWVSLIEVGEAAGTMPIVLGKLASHIEQQAAFRSTIISAIMYPAILFVICLGAICFFALYVGPRFESVFKSMDVELPLITTVLLSSFRFLKENFILILMTIAGLFFLFKSYAKTPAGRRQTEEFLFGMPVFGNTYKLIIIERFAAQMAILVDSGVPILFALDITQRLVDNVICAKVIGDIKESVRQGELLVAPMQRSSFFPAMCLQMITVGEETGELGKMLKHVAHFYQDSVETFMKRLGTVIEPFMLVFMGAVIGIIVLAMFLPMFNLSQLGGASH